MQITLAIAAFAAAAYAQCNAKDIYDGEFAYNPVNITSSSTDYSGVTTDCGSSGITLSGGVLTSQTFGTGEEVANYQFQFDKSTQVDAKATKGFGVCSNNTLALNDHAVWWVCTDGTDNGGDIYGWDLSPVGKACFEVFLEVISCSSSNSSSGGGSVTTASDGQPKVTQSCQEISTTSDGQPKVVTSCPSPTTSVCVPVTYVSDGQPKVSSCPTTSVCADVTYFSDGQPKVSSCATPTTSSVCVDVTYTSDGQPKVSSCPATSPAVNGVAPGTTPAATTAASSPTQVPVGGASVVGVGSQIVVMAVAVVGVALL